MLQNNTQRLQDLQKRFRLFQENNGKYGLLREATKDEISFSVEPVKEISDSNAKLGKKNEKNEGQKINQPIFSQCKILLSQFSKFSELILRQNNKLKAENKDYEVQIKQLEDYIGQISDQFQKAKETLSFNFDTTEKNLEERERKKRMTFLEQEIDRLTEKYHQKDMKLREAELTRKRMQIKCGQLQIRIQELSYEIDQMKVKVEEKEEMKKSIILERFQGENNSNTMENSGKLSKSPEKTQKTESKSILMNNSLTELLVFNRIRARSASQHTIGKVPNEEEIESSAKTQGGFMSLILKKRFSK